MKQPSRTLCLCTAFVAIPSRVGPTKMFAGREIYSSMTWRTPASCHGDTTLESPIGKARLVKEASLAMPKRCCLILRTKGSFRLRYFWPGVPLVSKIDGRLELATCYIHWAQFGRARHQRGKRLQSRSLGADC